MEVFLASSQDIHDRTSEGFTTASKEEERGRSRGSIVCIGSHLLDHSST